jgi:hypothetical protein
MRPDTFGGPAVVCFHEISGLPGPRGACVAGRLVVLCQLLATCSDESHKPLSWPRPCLPTGLPMAPAELSN